jgi:hypothetical protein
MRTPTRKIYACPGISRAALVSGAAETKGLRYEMPLFLMAGRFGAVGM